MDGATPRLAFVLRCTLRIIGDGLRRGAARLLIAERGKFATLLAKASDEANELRFVGGLRFVCSLSGHGGLAGEDELRDVSESDSVTAGDALASELPDEIAEEEIDLIGDGETVDVVEKLGGEDLGIHDGSGCAETFGVIGAERWALGSVSALRKPGSRFTRARMVSLKPRVKAIVVTFLSLFVVCSPAT